MIRVRVGCIGIMRGGSVWVVATIKFTRGMMGCVYVRRKGTGMRNQEHV